MRRIIRTHVELRRLFRYRCLRELEVPHFHHELVYEALLVTIEDMHDAAIGALVKLLKECDASGIVTPQQMQRVGLSRSELDLHQQLE